MWKSTMQFHKTAAAGNSRKTSTSTHPQSHKSFTNQQNTKPTGTSFAANQPANSSAGWLWVTRHQCLLALKRSFTM
jgi:hypothetical protein